MPAEDVAALLKRLTAERDILSTLDSYYQGDQPLNYIHPEVREAVRGRLTSLVINWPRIIVGVVEERLDVEGFRLTREEPADEGLWGLWQGNNLDEQCPLVHVDALVFGRSFVSVWPGEEGPQISGESALHTFVDYKPGTCIPARGVKVWQDAKRLRATLFLADRVETFVTAGDVSTANGQVDTSAIGKPGFWQSEKVELHPYGVVPLVPFVNRTRLNALFGESEMADIMPIADAVNKLATDMMVTSEFYAMPRRYAIGVEMGGNAEDQSERKREEAWRKWSNAAAGRVWLTENDQAKMGQFPEASLGNFVTAIGMLTGQLAALGGIPPHYLGINTDNPASADAIRSAESSLVKKAKRKQVVFGGAWEQVMRLATAVERGVAVASLDKPFAAMETVWRDPETPTVAQRADAAVKLVQAGVIDEPQAQEDIGYSPVQIERMAKRKQAAVAETATSDVRARVAEAQRLMDEQGLTPAAAYAAVGLLAAAAHMPKPGEQTPPSPDASAVA